MARVPILKILAGAAGVAAAGAAWFYWREKRVESPKYELVYSEGGYEIRRYPALIIAEVRQSGSRDRALGNGFGELADYIFAESRADPDEDEEIDMTVPVVAVAEGRQRWRIRFFMPKGWTRETLPLPGPGVIVTEQAAREVAVLRFGGRADDALLTEKAQQLVEWVKGQARDAAGPVEHAFFNSPMIPGPLRQNEVWLPLQEK
jgi:hypothetical protein